MANHKSTLKRMRSDAVKRLRNRFQHKTVRTFIKRLRETSDKKTAETLLPKVTGLVDRLAKNNVIHNSKANNLKSKLAKHVASL